MRYWFDTEFIETGSVVHMLSVGIIAADGRTYYAQDKTAPLDLACPWVKKNVFPHLEAGAWKERSKIATEVREFCRDQPEFWAWYGAYDWVVLSQLYGRMIDVPRGWPMNVMDVHQYQIMLGIPDIAFPAQTTPPHHALNDAVWTKGIHDWLDRNASFV